MLDTATKAQLKSYLERATQPIEIVASLDDSNASGELLSLLKDVAESSPLVKLTESRDDSHRKPSFSVNRPSENHGPRFAGLPMGHEFTSLILALLQIGGYPPKVEQAIIEPGGGEQECGAQQEAGASRPSRQVEIGGDRVATVGRQRERLRRLRAGTEPLPFEGVGELFRGLHQPAITPQKSLRPGR